MKIFRKKIMKLGNKGLTMVELICAVAILSLLGTTISGMMVVSADSYRSGTAETEVQQETQMVANQISDLVIDATSSVKTVGNSLVIQQKDAKNTKITIGLTSGKLQYTQTTNPGEDTEESVTQLLAENVTEFNPNTTDFAEKGYIKVKITIKKGSHEYPNYFTITSRNAVREDVTLESNGPQVAILVKKWLLEPWQTLELDSFAEVTNGSGTIIWAIDSSCDAGTQITVDPVTSKSV